MVWANLASIGQWLEHAEPVLPLLAGLLSIGILFGCAIASWLAPTEEEDGIFHREVV